MNNPHKVIGVGSPIIDHMTQVDEETISLLTGGKDGMKLIEAAVMDKLLGNLCDPVGMAPGGSAANTCFALPSKRIRGRGHGQRRRSSRLGAVLGAEAVRHVGAGLPDEARERTAGLLGEIKNT